MIAVYGASWRVGGEVLASLGEIAAVSGQFTSYHRQLVWVWAWGGGDAGEVCSFLCVMFQLKGCRGEAVHGWCVWCCLEG